MRDFFGDAGEGEDWAWVSLQIDAAGRIAGVGGEGPGSEALGEALPGLTPLQAAAIAAPGLAGDALAAALEPALSAPADDRRVLVAMSGGVDSAVALLRVRESGLEPVGATLRLWIDPAAPSADRACCAPDAVRRARRLCHDLGVAHVTLDAREGFRATVVREFVEDYASGLTPNPCVRCNAGFRFDRLIAMADRLGAARVATGHYARIVERDGQLLIARAADPQKDQSYMLARLGPQTLGRLWFPLGEQTKEATRAAARAAGLAAAERPESQEACFLGGDDYRAFLERRGLEAREGPVVGLDGTQLGTHAGYWRFTPGQRRGLRISGREPLFTVRTDSARNTVVVGPRASLGRRRVTVEPGHLSLPCTRADAKLRYRSSAVPAHVTPTAAGFRLDLDEPVESVAPGQVAVLYDGDVVVGSGLIADAA